MTTAPAEFLILRPYRQRFPRLAMDPNQPTRLAAIDALRDQLQIPLLLLRLNPHPPPSPVPHRNLQNRVGVATSAGIRLRYIGSSSYLAGEIVEAQWAAREQRLERFRTEQPPYSILVRGAELDVLPTAKRHGMGILTYSPLAGGWLSGTWTAGSSPTSPARQRLAARFDMSLVDNQRKLQAVEQLATVADDAGASLIELAIAFVVNHPAVTSAIIGPRTMEQLDSQIPAAEVALDPATLDRIDEIVKPGVNLNPADTSYGDQALKAPLRRR